MNILNKEEVFLHKNVFLFLKKSIYFSIFKNDPLTTISIDEIIKYCKVFK